MSERLRLALVPAAAAILGSALGAIALAILSFTALQVRIAAGIYLRRAAR